jgi:hypothetical protein
LKKVSRKQLFFACLKKAARATSLILFGCPEQFSGHVETGILPPTLRRYSKIRESSPIALRITERAFTASRLARLSLARWRGRIESI